MADVYLDACCFIYLVEGQPAWRTVVEKRIRDLRGEPGEKQALRLIVRHQLVKREDDD